MKKVTYPLLVLIIGFLTTTLPVVAQQTESRQVSGFTSVVSGGPFDVHIKIDGTETLKISSTPDIIQLIETKVENGTLTIKFKDNLGSGQGNSDGPINIYVTAKSLTSLIKNGSGFIRVDGVVTGKDVHIVLNGSGIIESSVKSENLKVTVNGSGSTLLKGNAEEVKVSINGPGSMNGRSLQTADASVVINGAGSAHLKADKTLSASVVGTGNVFYSGNAIIAAGSGGVSKEN